MNLEEYKAAVAIALGKRLGLTPAEVAGECEGLEDMLTDGLSPDDAAGELVACMADSV